jgi:hypothetical protein
LSNGDPAIGPLNPDIPDTDPFFSKYGPSFELAVSRGSRTNKNTDQELDDILEEAFGIPEQSAF